MSRPRSGRAGRNARRPGDDAVMHAQRNVTPSPWVDIAYRAAGEWFRDNPGAPLEEFDTWVVEVWEPEEFLRSGCGWRPGRPVNLEAFAAARRGLREALGAEVRRRAGRDAPPAASDGPVGRPAGHGAGDGRHQRLWEAS